MNISDYSPESLEELHNFVDEFFNKTTMEKETNDSDTREKSREIIINYLSQKVSVAEAEERFHIIEMILVTQGPPAAVIEIIAQCSELGLDSKILILKLGNLKKL